MWLSLNVYVSHKSVKNEEGKHFGYFYSIAFISAFLGAIYLTFIIPYGSSTLLF